MTESDLRPTLDTEGQPSTPHSHTAVAEYCQSSSNVLTRSQAALLELLDSELHNDHATALILGAADATQVAIGTAVIMATRAGVTVA
jgi:hypothetical protein